MSVRSKTSSPRGSLPLWRAALRVLKPIALVLGSLFLFFPLYQFVTTFAAHGLVAAVTMLGETLLVCLLIIGLIVFAFGPSALLTLLTGNRIIGVAFGFVWNLAFGMTLYVFSGVHTRLPPPHTTDALVYTSISAIVASIFASVSGANTAITIRKEQRKALEETEAPEADKIGEEAS